MGEIGGDAVSLGAFASSPLFLTDRWSWKQTWGRHMASVCAQCPVPRAHGCCSHRRSNLDGRKAAGVGREGYWTYTVLYVEIQ